MRTLVFALIVNVLGSFSVSYYEIHISSCSELLSRAKKKVGDDNSRWLFGKHGQFDLAKQMVDKYCPFSLMDDAQLLVTDEMTWNSGQKSG